jgi:hypothetical protein
MFGSDVPIDWSRFTLATSSWPEEALSGPPAEMMRNSGEAVLGPGFHHFPEKSADTG